MQIHLKELVTFILASSHRTLISLYKWRMQINPHNARVVQSLSLPAILHGIFSAFFFKRDH